MKRTVLVTDAGLGSSLSIIRSLGRRGWRVIAAEAERGCPAFRSRYAAERLVYPHPETDPEGCIEAVYQAARDRKAHLVIPVTDAVILPLSRARRRFDGLCRLALPEED